jgi:threonine/homoserine/homoserine lactone efflux protein
MPSIPEFLIYFSLALGYSFIGSMPPATGNILTIQLSITKGIKSALLFAFGEVIFEFIYGYLAWRISDFIADKNQYDLHLKLIAIPVFLIMSAYFFFNKKNMETEPDVKLQKSFSYGLLIGLLNPLAIPFWVYNISLFFSNGWVQKDSSYYWFFLAGIPTGSFLLLMVYAFLGKGIKSILKFRIEILNRIIAMAFLLLAIIQTILLVTD